MFLDYDVIALSYCSVINEKAPQSGSNWRASYFLIRNNTLPVQPGGWAQQQHVQQKWLFVFFIIGSKYMVVCFIISSPWMKFMAWYHTNNNNHPKVMPISETQFSLPGQTGFYRGKVRDVYYIDDLMVAVATDRISAFDYILPRPIPYKGQVLNQ